MAALNYEINLHCDDSIRNGRLFCYPLTIAGLFILGLIILAGIYLGALLYVNHLKTTVTGYEADVSRLIVETEPLKALEERSIALGLKASLEAELQPAGQPISIILLLVNREASASLNISSVTVERGSLVHVSGTSSKMQSVAAYSQALEDMNFIKTAEIREIKLAGSGLYSFQVELRPGEDSFNETGE